MPKRGFYEYPLSFKDMAQRAGSPLSFVMEESGRIRGYVLAYTVQQLSKEDPIHQYVAMLDQSVVYLDQVFLHAQLPLPIAGRLFDVLDSLLQNEKVPGVVAAIPEHPWKNQSSVRMAYARGFSPRELITTEKVGLRLFTKPYLRLDNPFEGFGDSALVSTHSF